MTSSDAACVGPSGATGIACDAETAARPSPSAKTDAASIFIGIPFPGWAVRTIKATNVASPLRYCDSPVVAATTPVAPTAAMPAPIAAAAPAPVPAAPAPMAAAPAAMAAAAPAHLFRLQLIGLFFRSHGGLCGIFRQLRIFVERMRHQRRGLHGCGERGDASGNACSDLEKFPAFHFLSLLQSRVIRNEFRCADMNAC